MIRPTVGRVVWFWPKRPMFPHDQPQAAMIAHVFGDRCVNLSISDPNGNPVQNPPTSIPLIQQGDIAPESGHYCEWMPFGQAVKAEAPEKKLQEQKS